MLLYKHIYFYIKYIGGLKYILHAILKIVIDVISSKTLVRKYVSLKRNNSRNPTWSTYFWKTLQNGPAYLIRHKGFSVNILNWLQIQLPLLPLLFSFPFFFLNHRATSKSDPRFFASLDGKPTKQSCAKCELERMLKFTCQYSQSPSLH